MAWPDTCPFIQSLVADLRQELAAVQEDHKVELYALQRERDDLADQIEDLKLANNAAGGARQGRRSLKSQVDSDAEDGSGSPDRSSATAVAQRSALIAKRDETIRQLEERISKLQAQLITSAASKEELQAQLVDLQSSKESLERDMAFLKDRVQLSEARLEKEGEDASREMMAMQHALDERMQNEIEHWKDQVTSWKLQFEKQELRCDELETACEDWEGKFVDLEYEMRRVEAECNEKEEVSLCVVQQRLRSGRADPGLHFLIHNESNLPKLSKKLTHSSPRITSWRTKCRSWTKHFKPPRLIWKTPMPRSRG